MAERFDLESVWHDENFSVRKGIPLDHYSAGVCASPPSRSRLSSRSAGDDVVDTMMERFREVKGGAPYELDGSSLP
jgi:hypothetical protein